MSSINYINIPRDFERLQDIVRQFLPETNLKLLENHISHEVKKLVVEIPYVDKDFRDTYYNNFSKRHKAISRDSMRIHFFTKEYLDRLNADEMQNAYLGFITLRETPPNTIGRSYISPKAFKNFPEGYYCLATYSVELFGREFLIKAFPWMQQDVNVTVCAHISAWSVVRFFSEKYSNYPEKTIYEIAKLPDTVSRTIPSSGLTVEQISQILFTAGFSPEIYMRHMIANNELFEKIIYIFIESGLPCIASLESQKHAIVLIGHGILNDDGAIKEKEGIVDSSELLNEIIISDDNKVPYQTISKRGESCETSLCIDNIDTVIVPYYEKMYIDARHILEYLLPKLEENVLNFSEDEPIIRRILLTSSKSYKKFISEKCEDPIYRLEQLKMALPKFIWIVEYSPYHMYKSGLVDHRVIIDATMLQYDKSFLHVKQKDKSIQPDQVFDNIVAGEQGTKKLNVLYEPMYINNLQEVKT